LTNTVVASPTRTATAATGGNTFTFSPSDDAYIYQTNGNTNYGLATTLQTDNSPVKNFLLKFGVSGLSGQIISSAKLRLYVVDASDKGGNFYRVNDTSWQQGTVTWNNAPTADTTLLASLGSVSANTWYEVDVTSLITGNGMYSWRVSSPSSNGADYSSKEGANPPQLVIQTQNLSTATITPSPVVTMSSTFTPTITDTPSANSNLVLNPGFEMQGNSAADAVNWTEGINHIRASDKFHTGNWSLHSTFQGAGTSTYTTAPIPVSPNTTYTYSGYIWRTNSTGAACMDMADIAGETQLCTSASGNWQLLSGTWNSGPNTSVTLRLITDGSPTGDIWFDDISLVGSGSLVVPSIGTDLSTATQTSTETPIPTDTDVPTETPTPTETPMP
jgi:hypothetical protein